jgi:adenylate cyclase class IV
MPPQFEYEYRYPTDAFDMREIVRRAGALIGKKRTPSVRWSLLVNRSFFMPGRPDVMLRVRTVISASHRVRSLLTLKLPRSTAGGFEQEYETWVEDGEAASRIVLGIGLVERHVMEKMRGTVTLPGVGEIAFDINPGLPASMEVECTSKKELDRTVAALGLLGPPTKEMRSRSTLEGQYVERYGVDGVVLKAKFRDGQSLTFSDAAPLRAFVPEGPRRSEFDREYARQAKIASRFSGRAGRSEKMRT